MRIRRTFKWLVASIIVVATGVGTGPTIWRDALANLETYLHISRGLATAVIVVPVGLICLIVVFVRLRNWFTVRRQHLAARRDALRNLRV